MLRWESGPIRCDQPAGHSGAHSGADARSEIKWSMDAATGRTQVSGVSGPSVADQRESYADIEVDACMYCEANEVDVAFVFVQPAGLPVAVPGRIGLCSDCHRLLQDGDFAGVLDRSTNLFQDFPDDAVLELIRASRAALFT